MLTFDLSFHSDGVLACVLWADETVMGARAFRHRPQLILEDVLHGGNAVHDDANMALCEKERARIEAACRRAFANRPSTRVKLEPSDFSQ
jgi:hypothetical protein